MLLHLIQLGRMFVVSFMVVTILLVLNISPNNQAHCEKEGVQHGSVYCNNRNCTFEEVLDNIKSTAYGVYNGSFYTSGWDILDIKSGHSRKRSKNDDIMYGAGFLEGVLTGKRLYDHYLNIYDAFLGKEPQDKIDKIKLFFKKQDGWMRNMIVKKSSDPFWRAVGYIIAQYDGFVAGYGSVYAHSKPLDIFAFQLLNGVGDLLDILHVVNRSSFPDFPKMSSVDFKLYLAKNSHCSALIKVLGGFENIFMSHSSWFEYAASMRIYKYYDFNVIDEQAVAAKRISFSSYPGLLESLDDFYLLGSQMVMLQTTNNIFNVDLYKSVTPESLLAWQRVRVANMMANSGREWAEALGTYNSGTYNNQYMVIDLKRIELKKVIHDDALWIVEQIPTLVKSGDQSAILRAGYWPSYNTPFFEEIYNKSGYPLIVDVQGLDYSYQLHPRAKIFRRDQGKVVDMATMKEIMRYNDYPHDPYSENNPYNSICSRGDLLKPPSPNGCYDTKVSDFTMALQMKADIINGPTLGSGFKPFEWTSRYNVSHVGLPKIYNFSFIQTSPLFPSSN